MPEAPSMALRRRPRELEAAPYAGVNIISMVIMVLSMSVMTQAQGERPCILASCVLRDAAREPTLAQARASEQCQGPSLF